MWEVESNHTEKFLQEFNELLHFSIKLISLVSIGIKVVYGRRCYGEEDSNGRRLLKIFRWDGIWIESYDSMVAKILERLDSRFQFLVERGLGGHVQAFWQYVQSIHTFIPVTYRTRTVRCTRQHTLNWGNIPHALSLDYSVKNNHQNCEEEKLPHDFTITKFINISQNHNSEILTATRYKWGTSCVQMCLNSPSPLSGSDLPIHKFQYTPYGRVIYI
jgi:hypothetical protein